MRDFTRPQSLTTGPAPLVDELSAKSKQPSSIVKSFMAGLDGSAIAIPSALGSVVLVYAKFPPEYLPYGVFATLLALALTQFVSGLGGRPMLFTARLFEATALAAMLDSFMVRMPAWGMQPQPRVLLALLCLVGVVAACFCALLYLLRADRFTRLIPAPVYSGFAISIAGLLLLSQSQALISLWQTGHTVFVLATICAVAVATDLSIRRFYPYLPASAIGLVVGSIVGIVLWLGGSQVSMVMVAGQALRLPVQVADFSALTAPGLNYRVMLPSLFYNGLLIGLMIFINTTVASENISQTDDRNASRWQHAAVSVAKAAGAFMGSAPVSGSQQASFSAIRIAPVNALVAWTMGAVCVFIAVSGALNFVALAVIAAVMLCEAPFMADRKALAQGWQWVRGKSLQTSQKEDLGLVAAVSVTAIAFNLVVALFIGLLFGLLLFAARNAKKPVRYKWTGSQLQSNCARSRTEIAVLARHGSEIKVLELEGELFFGAVGSLDRSLRESLDGAQTVILDWSRVRHVDSSIALSLLRWQRAASAAGVWTLHAGSELQKSNVSSFLEQRLPSAALIADLDRALEVAENTLLAIFGPKSDLLSANGHDEVSLLKGITAAARGQVEALMPQQFYKSGEVLFCAGDESDRLFLVLQGSAGVICRHEGGHDVRLTSVRRGGTIGEVGFLDGANRSATVVAQEELLVAVLTRNTWNRLLESHPNAAHQMLVNLALDLSFRLRHTTRLATARSVGALITK